jgi:hypothetical protein
MAEIMAGFLRSRSRFNPDTEPPALLLKAASDKKAANRHTGLVRIQDGPGEPGNQHPTEIPLKNSLPKRAVFDYFRVRSAEPNETPFEGPVQSAFPVPWGDPDGGCGFF